MVEKRVDCDRAANPATLEVFSVSKQTTTMQVRLHARNTFSVIMAAGFIYLAYLIFFESGDGFPEIDVDLKDVVSYAVLAVEMGGHAVKKVHEENALNIEAKGLTDEGKEELLTKADIISNSLILDLLQRFPKLKVVSEEKPPSSFTPNEVNLYRSDNYLLWESVKDVLDKIPSRRLSLSDIRIFVDPLDATQEFTENLTEYVTVMACICAGEDPIFGAIYRPFYNETIFGLNGWGVMNSAGKMLSPVDYEETAKKIVVSRSHAGKVKEMAKKLGSDVVVESAGGSGYKTLRLVNGTAEIYLHTTAIKKWDTCAGDAILRAMGGAMLDLKGEPLRYSLDTPILNEKGLLATVRNPYTYLKKFENLT
ncbi:unnamed protein product [Caenorhabditis auriculariae]|uniref:Putative inositol monophosphatase 3 n=1 Tax=Caenorhabditis auriculariae TaxID=2777116 RepID=A0A8S1GPL0_9PELO|nr:unnamed protein product [Caenorhabditis auriculariae]